MNTLPVNIGIRLATAADAENITALINAAFALVESFFIDGPRVTLQSVREYLTTGEFLLAENANKIVGCVYLEPRGERTYLGLLSVDPTLQKSGVGSLLIKEAEDRWRDRDAQYMDILTVNLREELTVFYGKRGYFETGTSPFPADTQTKLPCHFINMSKRLSEEVLDQPPLEHHRL